MCRDLAEDGLNKAPDGDAETLERKFWRNIPMNPPLYGADIPGSLFDDRSRGWSLRRLKSVLSETLAANGASIPGVTQPYLYVGSWRAFFAWHTEDMDLHSVNYLHHGAPKTWYVVPPAARERFELMVSDILPELSRECPEFLRHKEILLSPALLAAHNIPVVRAVHSAREFIVVGPGAYHAGFNHGYNIAESVNFATKAWVPVGARAGFCTCRSDSVKIDMRLFLEYMDKKLKAEVLDSYEDSDVEDADAYHDDGDGSAEEESDEESEESTSESEDEEEERSRHSGSYAAQGAHRAALPPPLRLPAKRVRKLSFKLRDGSPEHGATATALAARKKKAAAASSLLKKQAAKPLKRTTKNSTAGRGGQVNKRHDKASTQPPAPTTVAAGKPQRIPLASRKHLDNNQASAPASKHMKDSKKSAAARKKPAPEAVSSDCSDTRMIGGGAPDAADCCSRPSSKRTAARAWYQLFDTLLPALKRART